MKQEPNKEIDLLLRQLGRRAGSTPFSSGNGTQGEDEANHLDTDELNAYSENALPTAARARYTEHITECTRCRKLVSQLTLAAGIVVEEKTARGSEKSGLKVFLASFFSPIVLRYAVPALALLAVAFVGLMVFRQSTSRSTTYETTKRSAAENVAPKPAEPTSGFNQVERGLAQQNNSAANQPGEKSAAAKTDTRATPDDNAQTKPENKRQGEQPLAEQPAPANEPVRVAAGAATTAPKQVREEEQKSADVADKKVAATPETVSQTDSIRANEAKPAKAPAKEQDSLRVGGFAGVRSVSKSKSEAIRRDKAAEAQDDERARGRSLKDQEETETRSIAGRRFRKEGSVWIDVAYDSRSTTNLARGSEQYRALIADEPELKTIADQLDGEVIVMWKGRAYRIR